MSEDQKHIHAAIQYFEAIGSWYMAQLFRAML